MTTVLDSLNAGLRRALETDDSVYLLGEDLLDPYGGAFKVTRGLSSAFPGRILTTPISEAGFTGLAAGMALRGLRPVVELMFGDFITLAADQLVNHIAKFRWMYNDQVRLPLVLRTPMGGRRGYGPTHSQSLEKLFLGLPGIHVLAPTALGEPGELLAGAILETQDPVLFIENKLLYLLPLQASRSDRQAGELEVQVLPVAAPTWQPPPEASFPTPVYRVQVRGAPPPVLTLAAYGHMAALAQQALLALAYEHELFCELLVPTRLAPFSAGPLVESAARTTRLLALEESSPALGWGAEVLAQAVEALGPRLRAAARLAGAAHPVPASGVLEKLALPGEDAIVQAALDLVAGSG